MAIAWSKCSSLWCLSSSSRYGRLLEIKNVKSREIDGTVSKPYWIQTQVQMEVCDLNECDFLETKFIEYENYNSYVNDIVELEYSDDSDSDEINTVTCNYKGVILWRHYHIRQHHCSGENS